MNESDTLTFKIRTHNVWIDGRLYIEQETQIGNWTPHKVRYGPITPELAGKLRAELQNREVRAIENGVQSLKDAIG